MFAIIIACILLSLLFAPLGSILVWQRKAYFSDGLAHSCLLAASISSCFDLPVIITAPCISVIFALLVVATQESLASNSAINLVSSAMLALGLLLASILPTNISINILLFGDILSISSQDLLVLFILVVFVSIVSYYKIADIILCSLNADLAAARGLKIKRLEVYFLVLLALALSVGMKIIGALLITALLMIPSYVSALISKTPLQMICYSCMISIISCCSGIILSFYYDFATAPSIILSCSLAYCMVVFYRAIKFS